MFSYEHKWIDMLLCWIYCMNKGEADEQDSTNPFPGFSVLVNGTIKHPYFCPLPTSPYLTHVYFNPLQVTQVIIRYYCSSNHIGAANLCYSQNNPLEHRSKHDTLIAYSHTKLIPTLNYILSDPAMFSILWAAWGLALKPCRALPFFKVRKHNSWLKSHNDLQFVLRWIAQIPNKNYTVLCLSFWNHLPSLSSLMF